MMDMVIMMRKWISIFLFSNSLYGLAAVALAVENNLMLGLSLNHVWFYLLLFCGTVSFYTFSYQFDPHPLPGNRRAQWLKRNRASLVIYRNILTAATMLFACIYFYSLPVLSIQDVFLNILLLTIFPFVGFLYYGISFPGIFHLRLRELAWFKPFIIGAVWTGCVSFMPWVLAYWEQQSAIHLKWSELFLWLHTWMFISILSILFDIKDYAADHNRHLKTFIVRVGLRTMLYQIVMPLVLVGVVVLILFLWGNQFNPIAAVFTMVPMIMLLRVTQSMVRRRTIVYFLVIIDGMMIVKALFGIAASWWA